MYLSVAVSVPAPECLGVGHADYETNNKYLRSVKELLERNQGQTDMKIQLPTSQQVTVAQVPGGTNKPDLKQWQGPQTTELWDPPSSAIEISHSAHVDGLTGSQRNRTSTYAGCKDGPTITRRIDTTGPHLSLVREIDSGIDQRARSALSLPGKSAAAMANKRIDEASVYAINGRLASVPSC